MQTIYKQKPSTKQRHRFPRIHNLFSANHLKSKTGNSRSFPTNRKRKLSPTWAHLLQEPAYSTTTHVGGLYPSHFHLLPGRIPLCTSHLEHNAGGPSVSIAPTTHSSHLSFSFTPGCLSLKFVGMCVLVCGAPKS